MAMQPLLTFADVVDHCKDFLESYSKSARLSVIRRAVLDAYHTIATAHRWSFLQRNGRIYLYPRQTTGRVTYVNSTRTLTLSGATWPSWILDGSVRFGDPQVVCDVSSVESGTEVVLDPSLNYGRDVADSSYVAYQRWAWLPSDFLAFTGPFAESSWLLGNQMTLTELLAMDRYQSSTGEPQFFAIAEVPDVYDRKAFYYWPQMEVGRTSDFVYRRTPRPLRYSGQEEAEFVGTITTVAGSTRVSGSGTAFSAKYIGSILRIGSDGDSLPTSTYGDHPFAEERAILGIGLDGSITLDAAAEASRVNVRYVITDPIDLGGVVHMAFLRECERQLAHLKNFSGPERVDVVRRIGMLAERALLDAMASDNPVWSDGQDRPNPVFLDRVTFEEE